MFVHEKIPFLSSYLRQAGINPKYLKQVLEEYAVLTNEIIKNDIDHYEHTLDYIEAKGFLNDIENFTQQLR